MALIRGYQPRAKSSKKRDDGGMSRTPRPEAYTDTQLAIGQRIRQVRLFAGETKAVASRYLKVDPSTMAKIEDGTRSASIFFIIEVATRYRVTTDYLLRGLLIAPLDPEMSAKIEEEGAVASALASRQRHKEEGKDKAQVSDICPHSKKLARAG